MNCLIVPTLGLDVTLIERLAQSIDFPIKHKVAFNNGIPGALDGFKERHRDWIIKDSDFGNVGVAGSWNYVTGKFRGERTWLIMNDDAWFLPGYLERICKTADANKNAPIIYLNESQAYYCFVWTAVGKKLFGTFDENFFPGYYEDCDMRVRLRLGGANDYVYALKGLPPLPHGKPKTGGVNYAALIQGSGLLNRAYWLKKWGTMDMEKAEYANPYRDARITFSEWIWYPEHRASLYPLWEAFMSGTPSIYD